MTPDLDALEAKARAATPGPWIAMVRRWESTVSSGEERWVQAPHGELQVDGHGSMICQDASAEDNAYIAAMNPAVALAVIAEIYRLRGIIERLSPDGVVMRPGIDPPAPESEAGGG